MVEFTGERAVPGQIEPDLWNEHVARYVFAARAAAGRRVLDAGCGAGYGAAMLAERARSVVGVDLAWEALEYAGRRYARANLSFLRASATTLPFADGAFDLTVAFELIEHLQDWEGLLRELRRVTAPSGACLLSTPNRIYYAETRRESGPNPYHFREFDWREFTAELERFFPCVWLYVENHLAGLAIVPVEPGGVQAALEEPRPDPDRAHFLLAVCTAGAQPRPEGLLWAPRAANMLWERERHIAALEEDLAGLRREKQELVEMFRSQTAQLEQSNRWAASLDEQLDAARRRIARLQEELSEQQEAARRAVQGYEAKVAELEQEAERRAEWARRLEQSLGEELAAARAELEKRVSELAECVRLLDRAEATVVERTHWAQRLQDQVRELEARLAAVRASRWVRLGRLAGLGPSLGDNS